MNNKKNLIKNQNPGAQGSMSKTEELFKYVRDIKYFLSSLYMALNLYNKLTELISNYINTDFSMERLQWRNNKVIWCKLLLP